MKDAPPDADEDIAATAIRRSLKLLSPETAVTRTIVPSPSAFGHLLCSRKSQRYFSGAAIPQAQLERVLTDSAGGVRYIRAQKGPRIDLLNRTIPQSGGIYSVELYFAVLCANDTLPEGLYRFSACTNTVHTFGKELNKNALVVAMGSPPDPLINNASVVLFVTADLEVKAFKYGKRGYRYAIVEVGCALQNALLSISDQGLAGYPYGGFQDDVLARQLGLSFPTQAPFMTVIMGLPEDNSRTVQR